ncbi:defensin-like protein 20 [Pyrus ussuriensis x Pyrus communis]|uniref:Defensin-like protein 20 n=1 Tax=Pyrus ussuriensis x Pyrus communis TaxID=2448454 RepID=A0A5N5GWX2_9ROSA|nr:defensin-like protein 20 [Pyrus ussuriensis x Pyrus communis]
MNKFTITSFLLVLVLLSSSTVCKISIAQASKCCNNHPEQGKCEDGKCHEFCITDCEKGGFCKHISSGPTSKGTEDTAKERLMDHPEKQRLLDPPEKERLAVVHA